MDLDGKVCILTGSTSGIGKEAAFAFAAKGMKLVLPVRSLKKARALKNEIIQKTGNHDIDIYECDLASMESIRRFVENFRVKYSNLHLLINNAGLWETRRKESDDGIELTFAVNHLAPFLLTNLLLPVLISSAPARIVNVSSMAHKMAGLRFNDLEGKKRWSGIFSYAQSKLANILFTRKLARMLEGKGVTVNSLHPGVVYTGLYRKMPSFLEPISRLFFVSPLKGAETMIYMALSPEVQNVTGAYFVKKKQRKPAKQALNDSVADKLWEVSCVYTNLPPNKPAYGKTG